MTLRSMGTEEDHLAAWIAVERADYVPTKYGEDKPIRQTGISMMETEGYGQWWGNFVDNYLKRAELMGLDTPQGRQAMGKAITTLLRCLETAIMVHGSMPKPGEPSGEIKEWP